MSQVVITEDHLKRRRELTRAQERLISREDHPQRWRRSDVTGKDAVARLVGYGVLPVLGLWVLLTTVLLLMLTIVKYVFKLLGQVVGGSKSLILGK